jgi:hypothetical protein
MTPDPWKCSWCGTHYVIPDLARQCERRHEALTEETE